MVRLLEKPAGPTLLHYLAEYTPMLISPLLCAFLLPVMLPITVITDSRGMYLEDYIPDNILRFVDIRYYSGLTLHRLIQNLPNWKFLRQTRKVYVMVGINDCTALDRTTHTVRLHTPFVSGLYYRLKSAYRDLILALNKEFPTVRVVICPLYGMSVQCYNNDIHVYRYQETLDNVIPMINRYICGLNEKSRVRTPYICNVFHRYRPKRKSYIHLYDRLEDGLHPNALALEKIAEYMIRCFVEDL